MVGILACTTCIDTQHWDCWGADGDYVEGHLPVTHQIDGRYYDCWDHLQGFGTHVAMAQAYPESSVLQGAEEYLRYTAQRSDIDPQVRQRLLAALR